MACNSKQLQFHISTVKGSYWQMKWHIYPPIDLPVDLNGNFRFLLLELILADQPPNSGQEWQFHISIVRVHIGR